MSRIRFTPRFQRNLDGILDSISQDNPAAAKRIIRGIQKSISMLEDYPSAGRTGTVKGTRELIITR